MSLYNQNSLEHLENLKQKYSQRINDALEVFQTNLKAVKERINQKIKEDEQKTIDKFEKWVMIKYIKFIDIISID